MTFVDQPDFGAMAEEWHAPFMPKMIMDMWIEGDRDERREVDRLLEVQRRSQEREQWTMFRFD